MEAHRTQLMAAARRAVLAGCGPDGAIRDTLALAAIFKLPVGHPAGAGNWGVKAVRPLPCATLLGIYLGECRTGAELDELQVKQLQLRPSGKRRGDILLLDSLYELPDEGASDSLVMNAAVRRPRTPGGPSHATCIGGLFNDFSNIAERANIAFVPGVRGAGLPGIGPSHLALPVCFLITLADVAAGEELLVSYGDGGEYWPKMKELQERQKLLRSEEENARRGRPSEFIGRKVRKQFPGHVNSKNGSDWFVGTVTKVKDRYYHIDYRPEDSDSEDFGKQLFGL